MTKLKQYLRNSAKRGLLLNPLFVSLFILGCTSSTTPTFLKENLPGAIQDICKNEYKIDLKTKLAGSTLWIYLPVEDMFSKADKPEKYVEKFEVKDNKTVFKDSELKLSYLIQPIPEREKFQEYKYDKAVTEKQNNVWKALRRVLFSMERSKEGDELKFFCLVTADIKYGIEIKELFYYLDLKKVSYGLISWDEYRHRSIDETEVSQKIIGDKEGGHLNYRDITLEDFVAAQIQHRIKLKFEKPEAAQNNDIDKEILKIAAYTIKLYGLKGFTAVEFYNSLTQNRIIFNRAAIEARPID